MAMSKWLCSKSTKNMFVKIVYPGGHKELYDRPILASEIMLRNPKCIVAYPHVFQQLSAIVPLDTVLMQGHKFYVVPISTIKKLQRHRLKHSPNYYSPVDNTHMSDDQALNNKNLKEIRKECCSCMFNEIIKIKANNNKSDYGLSDGPSETKGPDKKRVNKELIFTRRSFCDNWQPVLESISEE